MVKESMNKINLNLIIACFIALLMACGGSKKAMISQSEIDSSNADGTLEQLYDKANQMLAESRGSAKKEITKTIVRIVDLLVINRTKLVHRTLSDNQTDYGLIDMDTLRGLKESIKNMRQWREADYVVLSNSLDEVAVQIEQEISSAAVSRNENRASLIENMKWMKKAAILSGKSSQQFKKYQEALAESIQQLSKDGRNAYKKRMFNLALKSGQQGMILDPGNIQFESLVSQSEAALFEQNFRASLEKGKPESAYSAFIAIADKPIMLQIKKKMQRSILLLANYFASNAQASYQKNQLFVAYSEFQRARDVQKRLGISTRGFVQEKRFLDLVMKKAEAPDNTIGMNYGLYSIIKEFDPGYPALEEKLSKVLDTISNRATTKLSVSAFKEVLSSSSVAASVGRRVSSKLEKILFEKLGNELQVVTDITKVEFDQVSGISLAINGEVLQAAIETTRNPGQRRVSANTGIKKTETEAYAKWKKRKRGDAPAQFVEEKIMDDVTIDIEHIKKLAIIEVAYRIVEPSTRKVLKTNNLVKEAKYEGDSTNELQKGLFHQRYIAADLPSDIKIMDQLASQLSNQLGESLVSYLAKPEVVFYRKYEDSLERGEFNQAIEMLSNAVVIAQRKNIDALDWMSLLKKQVLETK